ncbi:hypothetical protein SDC9_203109 [bioreactor metagenome]|uniref:Uncharacterized protein n=1 Tax=bioreactor metagenome TaxID=1076179 RepID=A0A645IWC3_9ZZZZ
MFAASESVNIISSFAFFPSATVWLESVILLFLIVTPFELVSSSSSARYVSTVTGVTFSFFVNSTALMSIPSGNSNVVFLFDHHEFATDSLNVTFNVSLSSSVADPM